MLAIDLGKTGCRAAFWRDGLTEARRTSTGVGAPGLATPDGPSAAQAAIASVCKLVLDDSSCRVEDFACCVGAAGAGAAPQAAGSLHGWLVSQWPGASVAVCSDVVIAHAGALGGRPGVLLLAGTGTVALALGGPAIAQVDGWGPLLDDAGGGGWIGTAGLRAVLRAVDGRGAPTVLLEAAVARFGPVTELARLVGGQHNPARLLASFAPAVAGAAETGDVVASGIIAAAAAELAGSALAAAERAQVSTVALSGGLWNLGPVLAEPVTGALESSGLRVVAALGDPLAGARLLAIRDDTVLEPLVLRAVGSADLPTVP